MILQKLLRVKQIEDNEHNILYLNVTAYKKLTQMTIDIIGAGIGGLTTAIALETGKGEFVTGLALGLVLFCLALMVNIALSVLKRKWSQ